MWLSDNWFIMLSLFVLVLFGILAAIFAGQNTQPTSVVIGSYSLQNVPLYGIILGSMLFGVFVSWLISLGGILSNSMTIRGKEGRIRDANAKIHKLEERNHELEVENAQLRGEEKYEEHGHDERHEENASPNPFVRLRQRFS